VKTIRHTFDELKRGVTVDTNKRTRIQVLPNALAIRLLGNASEGARGFLLPSALAPVRRVLRSAEQQRATAVLVVAHTPSTDRPEAEEAATQTAAELTQAFLEGDVDAWVSRFGADIPAKARWGTREQALMLRALSDFASREAGEDSVRWFQRTRGLKEDGIAGKITRTKLVKEYFQLGVIASKGKDAAEPAKKIKLLSHGCGAHFSGAAIQNALSEKSSKKILEWGSAEEFDRRLEFYLFFGAAGIEPAPGKPDGAEYLAWVEASAEDEHIALPASTRRAQFIEAPDALFRSNSCVVLPEGETPLDKTADGTNEHEAGGAAHESLSSVGIFAMALRFNEERPGRRLLIAGHTDTVAEAQFNQALSEERAAVALAILRGDRNTFKTLCNKRHTVADYKQILSWVTLAFPELGFACDPGKIDNTASTAKAAVLAFQQQYNRKHNDIVVPRAASITEDGLVGEQTWGAFFDLYQLGIRQELGEPDEAAVIKLREALVFLVPQEPAMGFGELHPIAKAHRNSFKSQTNRRVELLFFEESELPDVEVLKGKPEITEIYLPGEYGKVALPPRRGGAKRHAAFRVIVHRPPLAPPPSTYQLFTADGLYDFTFDPKSVSRREGELVFLEFPEVPLSSQATLVQVDDGISTILFRKVPVRDMVPMSPRALPATPSKNNLRSEIDLAFMTYNLDEALT